MLPVDKVGQEITTGSYVAYGVRDGNYGALRIGIVLGAKQEKNPNQYSVPPIITRITVRWAEKQWNSKELKCSKPVVVHDPERMLVIPDLPEEYKTCLSNP